jgi:hypothetical protein
VAESAKSPIIGENRWGEIEVDQMGQFRDVKLWPGGAREWDWAGSSAQASGSTIAAKLNFEAYQGHGDSMS